MPGSVSGNTRASRSRFSSPQTTVSGSAAAPKTNGTAGQRLMREWLEPPLQQKPSYQEAGLVRQGVVENMAPLGTLPSKKAVPHEHTPSRTKIIIKTRPPPSQPTPARVASPETTPEENETEGVQDEGQTAPAVPVTSAAPANRRSQTSREADDDYEPKTGPPRAKMTRRSHGRTTPTRRDSVSSLQASTPTPAAANGVSRPEFSKDEIEDIIYAAVDEAVAHHRYPTAYALKMLWEERSDEAEFCTMVGDVFSQSADGETMVRFTRLLRKKKKEGKKDNKGCHLFVDQPASGQPTPQKPKPKPAPYADLVTLKVPDLRSPADLHCEVQSAPKVAAAPKASASKRHKHRSPFVKMVTANGGGTAQSTPSRRRRKGSLDSSSDLSSARSVSPPLLPVHDADEQADVEDEQADDEPGEGESHRKNKGKNSSKTGGGNKGEGESENENENDGENGGHDGENGTNDSDGDGGGGGKVRPVPVTGAGAASSRRRAERSHAAAKTQPIATRRRSAAAKKHADVSPTPNPPSPTHNSATNAAAPGMLAAAQDALFPNLATSRKGQKTKEPSPQPSTFNFPSRVGVVNENDIKARLRRDARRVTNNTGPVVESFARENSVARDDVDHDSDDLPPPPPPESIQRQQRAGRPTTGRSTRASLKRSHDEMDDEPSPVAPLFPPPPEPEGSALNSRAGTPGPRAKRQRTGPRVKNSPVKRKDGPSAGVPRASGERSSPGINGAGHNQDDNDDYCSSCGGSGELVCCDGCTRSFHFKCVDPPFQEEGRLPEEWFCNVCLTRRYPSEQAMHDGAFASMMFGLDKQNSRAFRLPDRVRDYFDGVKTGADGEFEDANAFIPPKNRKKGTAEEQPDIFKLRDNGDQAVLCHSCGLQTSSNRAIIPCSACSHQWHLDCLDPPLARPPVLRTWKCPAHVDDVQAKVPGRAHKWRPIKGAPDIHPIFSRGVVNNGFINVDMDDEVSEEESGWNDVGTFGRNYALPAKGVKLDFLNRFLGKKEKKKVAAAVAAAASEAQPVAMPTATLDSRPAGSAGSTAYLQDRRPLDAAQAAQNVAAVAALAGPAADRTGDLIEALLSEADPTLVALVARANPLALESGQNLSRDNRQALEAMMARAAFLLEASATAEAEHAPEAPVTQPQDVPRAPTLSPRPSLAVDNDPLPEKRVSAPPAEYPSAKSSSPVNTQLPSSPTKPSDDEDTEIEDAPIATPLTAANDNSDGPDVAVAPADVPPGETEVEAPPKAVPVANGPAKDKIQTRDIIPTPSTSPVGTQIDADEVKTPAPQSLDAASARDDKPSPKAEAWAMELDS